MTEPFASSSSNYNALYSSKETSQEVAYLIDLFNEVNSGISDILEFGVGTGRHAEQLIQNGYHVSGIEISSEMAALAAKIPGLTCVIGDICTAELETQFDAVLALFHVASYQTTNLRVAQLFANAFRHLKPGGLFIFDVWYTHAVYSQQPKVRVKKILDNDKSIVRVAEPVISSLDNIVYVNYTTFVKSDGDNCYSSYDETHAMRHFSIPELQFYWEQAGFSLHKCEEWLTGSTPSDQTWGVCFALKKS